MNKIQAGKEWLICRAEHIVDRAKRIAIPFFDDVPLYDVALFFWKGVSTGAITTRASAIAFNFILAMFPAIIFLFTLIPYIPIDNFQEQLLDLIENLLPDNAFLAVRGTIEDIVTQPRGSLLSFGFFAAFFFATNGIVSVIGAFNQTIHTIETRSWWNQHLVASMLAVIFTSMITIGVGVITVSESVMHFLVRKDVLRVDFTYYLLVGGKWLVIIILFFFAFAFLFYFAPARRMKFRFISAGGSLATALSVILSIGFSFYINQFGKYNTLYGSIGTLVVVMLWLYFNALVLLIGFELNVSIWKARSTNSTVLAPPEEGDY
jgi:membrane protein